MKKLLSLLLAVCMLLGCVPLVAFADDAATVTPLTVENKLNMFKVVAAELQTLDNKTNLVFSLSGSGYQYLFKGNYEEAVAAGDAEDKWIKGETNSEGKLEFVMPIEDGESYIPVVAISDSYLTKYRNGQNPLSRAFYPRQITLDAANKTLVVEDYNFTQNLQVTNNSALTVSSAELSTVGGPNSNGYASTLALTVSGNQYTKAFIGTAEDAAAATDTVDIESGTFNLKVRWIKTPGSPDTTVSYIGEDTAMAFYKEADDQWIDVTVNIDEKNAVLTLSGEEESFTIKFVNEDGSELYTASVVSGSTPVYSGDTPVKAEDNDFTYTFKGWDPEIAAATADATYTAVFEKTEKQKESVEEFPYDGDSVKIIKKDGTDFGMMRAQDTTTAVLDGDNVVIHYVPNKTTYDGLYYGATTDGDAIVKNETAASDGSFDISLPKTKCGFAWPVVAIKKDGSGNAKEQYYLAIPAEDKIPAKETPAETKIYTVKFVNEDGTELQTATVEEGKTPSYTGETPVKAEDDSYTYTFKGWDPAIAAATADATYKATFEQKEKEKETPAETSVSEFPYDGDAVNFIAQDGAQFGMFTPQDGTTCQIDGDNVVIHYVPKNTTVYGYLYFGAITDELKKDITFNEDGTFDITLSKDKCGYAWPAAPIKTDERGGGTASAQYFLAIPAEAKLPVKESSTPSDGGSGGSGGGGGGSATPSVPDKSVDLTVKNEVKMFKVTEAKLVTEDGETNLVVTLSGSGYHYLYKGTYEDAKKTGYDTKKWIAGELNKEDKYVFSIPAKEEDTYIPIISISQTYVDKYLAKENSIERSFFPRQFTLDAKKKTLLVEDYAYSQRLKLSNKTDLDVSYADLDTVGGPNSNEYGSTLSLVMDSAKYTKAFIGTAKKAASSTKTINVGSKDTFSLKVRWVETMGDPDSVESYIGEETTFAFYNSETKKWEEFLFTINENKSSLTIKSDEEAETVEDQAQKEEIPAEGAVASGKFKDVKSSDWYGKYADKAAEYGLMTGYAAGKDANGNDQYEFRGSEKVTRAMFVTILNAMNTKIKGESSPAASAGFTDVKSGIWYEKAVNWAYANGVAAGRGTVFGVDDNVSRQDMAVFMYAYAKKIGKAAADPDRTVLDKFSDAGQIADYAKDAMAWLVSNGLMTGRSGNSIAPLAESTRAEISAFAVSCFDFLNK